MVNRTVRIKINDTIEWENKRSVSCIETFIISKKNIVFNYGIGSKRMTFNWCIEVAHRSALVYSHLHLRDRADIDQ